MLLAFKRDNLQSRPENLLIFTNLSDNIGMLDIKIRL